MKKHKLLIAVIMLGLTSARIVRAEYLPFKRIRAIVRKARSSSTQALITETNPASRQLSERAASTAGRASRLRDRVPRLPTGPYLSQCCG
jgi:hypothetical protein